MHFIFHIAQAPDGSGQAISWFTSLGGFGVTMVGIWLVMTGRLVISRELDAEKARRAEDKKIFEERLAESRALVQEWKTQAQRAMDVTSRSQSISTAAIEAAEKVKSP
jgi:hypothetical protein